GHLNQLLGRAHNTLYMSRSARPAGIVTFYRETYPRIFRETLPCTAAALALFLVAMAAGWSITLHDPAFPGYVLDGRMIDTIERREMWTHGILAIKPIASSRITTNNLTVCFTAVAAGITAGLGTAFIMLNNGLLMGVIGAACWRSGMSLSLWSFVAPHGALELPAIFIAGGAGLLLGRAILFPGRLPRRAALRHQGGRAVKLAVGAVPLLLLAGLVEGFVSPTAIPASLKFLIGLTGAGLLGLYLISAGRIKAGSAP
ncbi:MAG TPA: stage II sporulation protein M, partial [Candidatus Polarisedimenticolia bacterium]|nr:stage II sporulation protein M [Candidatus Polarisedimenticolia bacterium]